MTAHPRPHRDSTHSDVADALRRLLNEPTISIPDAARLLGIGRSTLYAAVKSGELPAIRVGNRVRIPSKSIRRILQVETDPDIEAQ
ncbi:helix-turn-helix domain-containing protein [Nocardia stercoris]|uniref:Helix-turn-helix domain-containing protein n=1 Tax=Nocardia stercoris TaxID=2483361 RepID=A0A3M2KRZ2_9NOCA|nr:helix-turn-helix domain-containing protein [Nocardia stercoris]